MVDLTYPAPEALVAHCSRVTTAKSAAPAVIGSHDPAQVAGLIRWLTDRGTFADYESWLGCGMALRLEFGDAGLEIWQLAHDDTVTPEVEASKWQSFASEPTPGAQTLMTWLARAHAAGWRGKIGKSTAAMFDGVQAVQAIAAAAGAKLLAPGTPGPTGGGGVPMLAGQATIADLGAPIVVGFNAGQHGRCIGASLTLPDAMVSHPLTESLNCAIEHILAIAERGPSNFRAVDIVEVLAVLSAVHAETLKEVVARVRGLGCALPDSKLNLAIARFETVVNRELRAGAGWRLKPNGEPDPSNADNVSVLLRFLGTEMRYNVWSQRIEIKPSNGVWSSFTDAELNHLRGVASTDEYKFKPTKDFMRDMLGNIARQTSFDPVLDFIDSVVWDGVPRLLTWLTIACGVPCNQYHQAVGRNVIGGIIRRVRHSGCKHDTVMILIGEQGCGKSELAKILALNPEWHTDSMAFEGRQQELIPQLHGKLVVELGELDGMNKKEAGYVKRFLSQQSDSFTRKYEAYATDTSRRCVFIGTCNLENPLVDDTGNRRFYPVRIPDNKQIKLDWMQENIGQLIGEAAALEATGESFAIPKDVWPATTEQQETARNKPEYEILLEDWFGVFTDPVFITAADLVRLVQASGLRVSTQSVGTTMRKLGFNRMQVWKYGSKVWHRGEMSRAYRLTPHQKQGDKFVTLRRSAEEAPGPGMGAIPLPRV